ncbi:hypothetical protein Ddye_017378 [Dipteronia dyeriana]|uniref:DEUBAD domain-containing protein n=1 Tax=Dipteronia dyeriana TaxID=168575 RepID=A0AAD9WZQ8_9ROSI|nr:hypothetical protein Ddye_017378 [Dipteronia dyeriana]
MGIVKTGQRGGSSFCKESSSSIGKDMKMEKHPVLDVDLEDDSDDYELAEVNCELGLVEGQLCNIPYELYDLPNLKEILSIETWNSCLTEEERFCLSAYLPDMGQQTFCLTMKELLGGSDMYFDSPLDTFFKRLKGGFYLPNVASFRECLQFLQRRKYYHSLRSYHDNMAEMFKEMSRLWNQCEKTVGVEGRIYKWRTRRQKRGKTLLDLNSIPEDGDLLGEWTNSDAALHHLSKKTNPLGSKRANNSFSSQSPDGMKFVTPNCNAKGVLKLRSPSNCSLQNHNPKLTSSDLLEQCRSEPKGLLKVVPKVPSIGLEHSKVVLRQPQPNFLGSNKGLVDHRISSLPVSVYLRDICGLGESPFLRQIAGDNEVHTLLGQSKCVLNRQESPIRIRRYPEGSTSMRKIKREANPSSDGIADLGGKKLFRTSNVEYESLMDAKRSNVGAKAWWQNLGTGSNGISVSSIAQLPLKDPCYKSERQIKPTREEHITVHPENPDIASRISDVDIGKQKIQVASSSDQMKGQSDASVKNPEKLFGKPSVSKGFKDDLALPLTYKRRKALAKHNTYEYGKPLTTGADFNSAGPK